MAEAGLRRSEEFTYPATALFFQWTEQRIKNINEAWGAGRSPREMEAGKAV
jgi:hypothetical protein